MKTSLLSNEAATKIAMDMVLMDAIEKGANQQELIAFMGSDACEKAVANYKSMLMRPLSDLI